MTGLIMLMPIISQRADKMRYVLSSITHNENTLPDLGKPFRSINICYEIGTYLQE